MNRWLLGLILLQIPGLPACPPQPSPPTPDQPFDCEAQSGQGLKLTDLPRLAKGRFIVLLKRAQGAQSVAEKREQIATFVARFPVLERTEALAIVGGFVAHVEDPARALIPIIGSADVRAVHPVRPVSVPEPIKGEAAAEWGLDRTDQRDLPLDGKYEPGEDGAGIHVVVLDTGGFPAHPDLGDRVEPEFFDHAGGGAKDDNGHGTHVATTIAGKKYGIAKAARVVFGKVLTGGSGDDAGVIRGIEWATDLCVTKGWHCVGNMSLGGERSAPLDEAVCRSIAAGVVWAVAAGNDGAPACQSSPSDTKQAIVAGASARDDSRASFSNIGKCVSLFAPGLDITAGWLNGGSKTISGTSMASPHVAGVAALLRSEDPEASPAEIKERLLERATPGKISGPGDGSPNLLLYYKALPSPPPPTPPPSEPPPTTQPSSPPPATPTPGATPATCPCCYKFGLSDDPHWIDKNFKRVPQPVVGGFGVIDSTQKWTPSNVACDAGHPNCGGRECNDPRGPLFKIVAPTASLSCDDTKGKACKRDDPWHVKVGSLGTPKNPLVKGTYTVTATVRPDAKDALGKPVQLCGNSPKPPATTRTWVAK